MVSDEAGVAEAHDGVQQVLAGCWRAFRDLREGYMGAYAED
jgi:hypothetical protein